MGSKKYNVRQVIRVLSGLALACLLALNQSGIALALALSFSPDVTTPSIPGGITASGTGTAVVSWTASTDNVGVVSYEVWRDGTKIATTPKTTYTDPAILPGNTYQYALKAADASGNISALSPNTGFTAPAESIWGGMQIPGPTDSGDTGAVELGVRFQPKVNGQITGVRFYKDAANTGTHTGNLWTTGGTNLATATFTGETTSGWQTVTFSTPVSVTAGTSYIASYFAPNGHYSFTSGYFSPSDVQSAHLIASKDSGSAPNAVFRGGSTGFPTGTFGSANYWVDVLFAPDPSTPPAGTNPPSDSVSAALSASPSMAGSAPSTVVGADGWRPIPYKNKIYNVFHHTDATYPTSKPIFAVDASTGAAVSGYPRAFNNGDSSMPTDLHTPVHATEYLDRTGQYGTAGNIYMIGQREFSTEFGLMCFNLDSGNGCGYWTIGNTGETVNLQGYVQVSAGYEVNGIFYALDEMGNIHGIDLATKAVTGSYNLNFPGMLRIVNGRQGPTLFKIGGKLLATMRYNATGASIGSGAQYQCFDPATNSICSGWPVTPSTFSGTVGDADMLIRGFTPMLTSAGVEDGFCAFWRNETTSVKGAYCFAMDGSSRSTPAALIATFSSPNFLFDTAQKPGTARTYIPTLTPPGGGYIDTFLCFDWATQANCADFGDTPGSEKSWSYLNAGVLKTYSIVSDPDRPNCMWAYGDSGYLVSFRADTGASPCNGSNFSVTLDPSASYCDGTSRITGWRQLYLNGLDSSVFSSATLTLRDSTNAVVPGFNAITLTNAAIDISAIPATGTTQTLRAYIEMSTSSVSPWQTGSPALVAEFDGDTFNLELAACTLSQIGAFVWEDTDRDGIKDSGETGAGGVTAELVEQSSQRLVKTATTASSGYYTFGNIAPGSYALHFIPPNGYSGTLLVAGSGAGNSSDADPGNDSLTRFVTVAAGNAGYVLGAGFALPASSAGGNSGNANSTGNLANTGESILPWIVFTGLLIGLSVVALQRRARKS